eukprot:c19057_g1_i2.p1 GENE.c19057_g1_i2~~c19057_g1_i2.p1  ORF type:complete len:255 (-),score=51.04 c19057_g1_i2:453-1145(-)
MWNLEDGNLAFRSAGHKGFVVGLDVCWRKRQIASGSLDKTIKLWDANDGSLRHTLVGNAPGPGPGVESVAYTPNGDLLLSLSSDATLSVWDVDAATLISTIPTTHSSVARGLAVTPDGSRFVTGSNDGTLKVWGIEPLGLLATLEGHKDWVNSVAVSGDGKLVMSVSSDGTLRKWDLNTFTSTSPVEVHGCPVFALAASQDGSQFVTAGWDDGTVKVWKTWRGEMQASGP